MKAKLMVNDIELEVDISEEELKKLQKERKKKTGYERVEKNATFYYISCDDEAVGEVDERTFSARDSYDIANYYSSYEVAENNARADRLMRKLRRFAVESRSVGIDWDNKDITKFAIFYNRATKKLEPTNSCNVREFGSIYFDLALHAHQAIETFHDELIWYFTEYKDSM